MRKRASGILLHVTSLPSLYGIGDFGSGAFRFIDFLSQAKQSYWQILPLNAMNSAFDTSPYHIVSAFANNKLLISPELLAQEGLLNKADLESMPKFPQDRVNYRAVIIYKKNLFRKAFENFKKRKADYEFEKFCTENSSWLEDFAIFMALKTHFKGRVWSEWPVELRDRQPEAIQSLKKDLHDEIEMHRFLQYVFIKQWLLLKSYCHGKGIRIIGDMPIYVDYDSADCWTCPDIFKLDKNKRPYAVSGVPPDYFSKTGQLWGNPLYRWDVLKKEGYGWWIRRIENDIKLYDIARIDHFRGFVGYWEVPSKAKTAVKGKWVKAPALDFFNQLNKRFRRLPIIAEDLGFITPDVKKVMEYFAFPGMKVLLFAFGKNDPMHPYLPHTYNKNCVVYTGTHDNNTVRGWLKKEAKHEDKRRVFRYLGRKVSGQEIHWEFIRLAMLSVANTVIIPMQDFLGLGEWARMNRPATSKGNWQWRLLPEQLSPALKDRLLEITRTYGRT
ncbi:MAG: 4-alpha-glucanotransferase [Candidatus Aminicenantes bacterium]|nr:4-alpha-glucanotransferase [Candidatus Aminicenantes bacterium]